MFALNLPIPVFLDQMSFPDLAGISALGCVLWCGTGILLCFRGWANHVRATSWGGLLVALSQFYPMLQLFAVIAAITITRTLVTPIDGNWNFRAANHSALLDLLVASGLTVLTGSILISIALVVGHTLLFLFRRLVPRSQP